MKLGALDLSQQIQFLVSKYNSSSFIIPVSTYNALPANKILCQQFRNIVIVGLSSFQCLKEIKGLQTRFDRHIVLHDEANTNTNTTQFNDAVI